MGICLVDAEDRADHVPNVVLAPIADVVVREAIVTLDLKPRALVVHVDVIAIDDSRHPVVGFVIVIIGTQFGLLKISVR